MSDKIKAKAWIKELKASKKVIGTERDRLRSYLDDIEDLAGVCDEAYDDIDHAIESLSCLV